MREGEHSTTHRQANHALLARRTPAAAAVPGPYAVVFRILGNDQPPLQSLGQTRRNLQFVLDNEERPPPGIERRWLLNRLVDASESTQMLSLLVRRKEVFVRDTARTAELQRLAEDYADATRNNRPGTTQAAAALRIYATNQNAARNKALRMSASVNATWALPLDAALYVRPSPRTRVLPDAEPRGLVVAQLLRPWQPQAGAHM